MAKSFETKVPQLTHESISFLSMRSTLFSLIRYRIKKKYITSKGASNFN